MSDSLLNQALAAIAEDKPSSAIQLLSGISEATRDATFYHARGLARHQLAEYASALEDLRRALVLGDRSTRLPGNIIFCARHSGALNIELLSSVVAHLTERRPLDTALKGVLELIEALDFHINQPYDYLDLIFEYAIIPLLRWSLSHDLVDFAIHLDFLCRAAFVTKLESAAHNKRCCDVLAPPFIAYGRQLRSKLDPLTVQNSPNREKVAFFIHHTSMLAHVEVLLNFVKSAEFSKTHSPPIIYAYAGSDENFCRQFTTFGAEVIMLSQQGPDFENQYWKRLLFLRNDIRERKINHIIWVSVELMMPLAFAIGIAPIQSWWSMKYHNLQFAEIDGYITGGSVNRFREIGDRAWRVVRADLPDLVADVGPSDVAAVREAYKGKILICSIARCEKLTDSNFLDCICDILLSHANVVFLWAGRIESEEIKSHFERRGVVEQTSFVGWVDTRLYAQVIDIFLDTFPFPCGLTALQSMAAGKPIVFYKSPESLNSGILSTVLSALDDANPSVKSEKIKNKFFPTSDKDLTNIASTVTEYKQRVSKLIKKEDWRIQCGLAAREFINEFYANSGTFSNDLYQHLKEIEREKRVSTNSSEISHADSPK